jgi:hypothetical protein
MTSDKEKSKFSITHKDEEMLELLSKTDHKILAVWAIDCIERVMPCFEEKYPEDHRPRQAIETLKRLALLPVLQVKRWQLHMLQLILLVLQIMPYRLSIELPTPLMPMQQ